MKYRRCFFGLNEIKRKKGVMSSFFFFYVVLLICGNLSACTSFAVYSSVEPCYGMNFDFSPDADMIFSINPGEDCQVFHMGFLLENNNVAHVCGINSTGLFSSNQYLYPWIVEPVEQEGIYLWRLHNAALEQFRTSDEVKNFLEQNRLIHYPNLTLHVLIADSGGDAAVYEVGDYTNRITPITGEFIVMTNFSNSDFADTDYTGVEGVGDERYRIAYEYLMEHGPQFNVDHGFNLLYQARNQSPDFPTMCSMVFIPSSAEVYIAIGCDFDRIWKVSIPDQTLELYRGSALRRTYPLDEEGLSASSLI